MQWRFCLWLLKKKKKKTSFTFSDDEIGGWTGYIIYSGVQMEQLYNVLKGPEHVVFACIPGSQQVDTGGA